MSNVIIDFDTDKATRRINGRLRPVQAEIDSQVLKDSNYFCPQDTGTLQASGVMYSDIGSGVLEWRTPYARDQYYSRPDKSKDKNPNATMKWFESAKARHKAEWEKVANDRYNQ